MRRRTAQRVALGLVRASIAIGIGFPGTVVVRPDSEPSQQRSTMETYDDLLVRVEERAPGFGGMFISRDGRLAVYLLDPSQLAAARSAIEAVFGPKRVPSSGVYALKGQYTVSQLKQWTERAVEMLEMPGVAMVDLDEAENRVAIGLEDKSWIPKVEQTLVSLGIPRAAFLIEVTGKIRPVDRSRSRSRSKD